MKLEFDRRTALRGIFNGTAVVVGLPLLDIFLDGNGQAMAGTGAPLPVRFGTWFWGCGVNEQRWFPDKEGADYDIKAELKPIQPFKQKINIFSHYAMPLDGKANGPHTTGVAGLRTGDVGMPAPSFDVLIGDAIGTRTRFRSLEMSAIGDSRNSLSGRGNGNINPAEISPAALYARIFGAGFQDPNSATFAPDPRTMARRSVLSVVEDRRKAIEAQLGASDKQSLDQYFTALRQLEKQLDVELTKPEPLQACVVPAAVKEQSISGEVDTVEKNHKLMTDLLVMALACDNARVFNMSFNNPTSSLTKLGSTVTHHQLTHEELVDEKLGYQPQSAYFVERCMNALGGFISALDAVKEGNGTLLDHTLLFAHSECNLAKIHSVDNIPMMTVGSAGGRIKTGLHISGHNSPVTRVGLTLQQIMGVTVQKWGAASLETNKPLSEILV